MSLELSYLQLKTSNEARITVGKDEMGFSLTTPLFFTYSLL